MHICRLQTAADCSKLVIHPQQCPAVLGECLTLRVLANVQAEVVHLEGQAMEEDVPGPMPAQDPPA